MTGNTTSREIPFLWLVKRTDPDFLKDRRKTPEYEFSNGRVFSARQELRGVYSDERSDFDIITNPFDSGDFGGGTEEPPPDVDLPVTLPPWTNPSPWNDVPWQMPGLTDHDIGSRTAPPDYELPSSIVATSGYLYRDDSIRGIVVNTADETIEGMDLRGWHVYLTVNAHRTIIRDCLFDQNCMSTDGVDNVWLACVTNYDGAEDVTVEYNDFVGDKSVGAGRQCVFIRHLSDVPMKKITRNKFFQSSNDAVETVGVTEGITHNWFFGMGYQDEAHADAITIPGTVCETVVEYNHIDMYGDGDFGTQVDPIIASVQSNAVRHTETTRDNLEGVISRYNTIKGGAFQVEPVITATCRNLTHHDEYRLLRWGPPHYPVDRSSTEDYQGPWGDIDRTTYGSTDPDELRYFNQWEVDYDGLDNVQALGEINHVVAVAVTGTLAATGTMADSASIVGDNSGVAPSGNPAPWDGITTWDLPYLTDTDCGKTTATASLLLPSTITSEAWNGGLGAFNPKWRDDSTRTVYVNDPDLTLSGYDLRGWQVYVRSTAHRLTITNNLFDANCTSGGTNLWYGAIQSDDGATDLIIERNSFIGDGVLTLGRGCVFIRHESGVKIKRISRNIFWKAPNDAIDSIGCELISHNYFYGTGYQSGAHGDAITMTATNVATVIEYNVFDLYADGLFGLTSGASAVGNAIRCTTTNGTNTAGVTSRFNAYKGGAWQHELDLGASGGNYIFHSEHRLLRNGAPWYTVSRPTDHYAGPYGGMSTDVGSPAAGKLRYYNQIEVDYDGASNDRALTSINAP